MKEATKRATSEALAHMLAVTALLVIASVLFYSSPAQNTERFARQTEQSAR
jgi:hypothetical protein